MHRYEELEKLYYKKLYSKIFFAISVIIVLIIGSIIYIQFQKKIHSKQIKETKSKNITYKKNHELKFILPDIKSIPKSHPKKIFKNSETSKNIESKIKKVNKKQIIKETPKIEIKESNINLNTLINEYKNNPTYNLAITIAKIYLKKNNLKQAQIWALKANSLNPSQPDSWIIFADILIKQHKIKKAKEILNVYITSYGNNDIIEEKLRSLDGK